MSLHSQRPHFNPARSRRAPALLVLGFAGPMGSGKTTLANALLDKSGAWRRISFADPIRDMLRAIGLTDADLSAGKQDPHPLLGGKTPRLAMQELGTGWGRQKIDDRLWLRVATHRALGLLASGACVVFDDVRFDNEAEMIHDLGGLVVHLSRPGHEHSTVHASEVGISPALIDHEIHAADVSTLLTRFREYLDRFHRPVA